MRVGVLIVRDNPCRADTTRAGRAGPHTHAADHGMPHVACTSAPSQVYNIMLIHHEIHTVKTLTRLDMVFATRVILHLCKFIVVKVMT